MDKETADSIDDIVETLESLSKAIVVIANRLESIERIVPPPMAEPLPTEAFTALHQYTCKPVATPKRTNNEIGTPPNLNNHTNNEIATQIGRLNPQT